MHLSNIFEILVNLFNDLSTVKACLFILEAYAFQIIYLWIFYIYFYCALSQRILTINTIQ